MKHGTTKRREKEIRRVAEWISLNPQHYASEAVRHGIYLGISHLESRRYYYSVDPSKANLRALIIAQHAYETNCKILAAKRLRL